jgi:hypothetical protein
MHNTSEASKSMDRLDRELTKLKGAVASEVLRSVESRMLKCLPGAHGRFLCHGKTSIKPVTALGAAFRKP